LLFGVGLVISFVMVLRSQVEGDQLNMLYHGWMLAFRGEWLQHGLNTSAGGDTPGGLLSLLVGLPLMVWRDHRAPAMLVWLLGLAGYLILDRVVGKVLGDSGRLAFAVFYWLNPWRVYFTSSLWNANYMIFLGSVHLWAAWRLRERRRFWASFVLVIIIGLGIQLHTSVIILTFATALLWWRGVVRVNWWGVAAGMLAVAVSLVPWMLLVVHRPEIMPGGNGFPFRNLLLVQPVLHGLMYLLRYPSLAVPSQLLDLDFEPARYAIGGVSSAIAAILTVVGGVTVLLSGASYWRFLRHPKRMWQNSKLTAVGACSWLRRYVFWTLAGTLIAFAVSPTTIMFWQGFPIFHAAVLVVVLYVATVARSRHRLRMRRLVACYVLVSLVVVCAVGVAGPLFRPPGLPPPPGPPPTEDDYWNRMRYDHPMFHDLKLFDRCRVMIDPEYGQWPDSFPDP